MNSENGQEARDFTYAVLMNKRVRLDIDDLSANGQDSYGRLICVSYLKGVYGQPRRPAISTAFWWTAGMPG
jgi:hypothetical protein